MLKWLHKMFYPKVPPLPSQAEQLISQIYYTSGPHIRNAYTEKEVMAACLDLASSYPASMEVTLYALQSGNTMLSRYFVEKLADIGRENEKNA